MATSFKKENDNEFIYRNTKLNLLVVGEYVLDENGKLFKIICKFTDKENVIHILNGLRDDYNTTNYSINCSDLDLLSKLLSVYNDIVEEIEKQEQAE